MAPSALPEEACDGRLVLTLRKSALFCVVLGAHLVLFWLMTSDGNFRKVRRSEQTPGVLFFVDLAKPVETPPSTQPSLKSQGSNYHPSLESRTARDNTITVPPEIEGNDAIVDWAAEASRVATDAARRLGEEKKLRSLDQHPAGMGPPPPKRSHHELGDSQHFEGGVIIDWVGHGCYYSNQNAPVAAFGQALRLQLPICTGASGPGAKPLPSLEEWKKERDSR